MVAGITCQSGDRITEWNMGDKRLSLYVVTDRGRRYIGSVTNFDWQSGSDLTYQQVTDFSNNVLSEDQHWI